MNKTQLDKTLGTIKNYVDGQRKITLVGSNTADTAGWYKVAEQTCSGHGDTNITFAVTSTYSNYYSGILELQVRSDNTSISCKVLKWLTRIGFDVNHFIVVISGMKWTLYAYQPLSQYGRIAFEILSETSISSKNQSWALTFKDNGTRETTAPTATVKSTDGATVASANKLSTARTISLGGVLSGSTTFDGSGNVSITAKLANGPKSGDWWNSGPMFVNTDGAMEAGKYLDFHNTDTTTNDYSTRLQSNGDTKNTVNLPTASGTLALTSDNVASATKLATARTINGTSFDGSGNITTANWGTARNIYIADSDATNTGAAVSVNGSGNATLKLPGTIKASLSGNASTATKLATARTINGTSFDGSANITTANWGTSRKLNGISVNGSADVLLPLEYHTCSVGNDNTNLYHHILASGQCAADYIDKSITIMIVGHNSGGCLGIAKCTLRTNKASGGDTGHGEINWLVRSNISENQLCYNIRNTAKDTYMDVFYKSNGTYASVTWYVLGEGARGGQSSSTWTKNNTNASGTNAYTEAGMKAIRSYTSTLVSAGTNGVVGNANKAKYDNKDQQIDTTYIKGLSVSGKTITYTKGDGSTGTITTQDTNTTYSNATTSAAGLMSASDKSKLDGIASSANNYSHPTSSGNKHLPSGGSSGNWLKWNSDGTGAWGSLPTASTSASGIVKLSSSTSGTSETIAATEKAVKAAYDKANHSHNYLPLAGGTMTGAIKSASAPSTYVTGAQKAVITSTPGSAGAYQGMMTGTTTNGSMVLAFYQATMQVNYLTKANVDSSTNTVAKTVTLMDESGNGIWPGVVTATGGFKTGGNIISDTALTDNSGTASVPWASSYAKNFYIYGEASKDYGTLRVQTVGTAETTGESRLVLGNSTKTGTASNAKGNIYLYGTGTGNTKIQPGNNTDSNITITLPSSGGTLARTSDNITGSSASCTGNAATATKLKTGRKISLTGDVTGNATFDGSADISITATVGNDSHTHSTYLPLAGGTLTGATTFNNYLKLNAWSGYGSGTANFWYDGTNKTVEIETATDLKLNGTKVSKSGHTHNYAGSSSAGGSATSAVKLDTSSAGSATQAIYWSGGKPVAGKSFFTSTAVGDIGWTVADNNAPVTVSGIAYWNGAYKGESSNLTYCIHGAFGSMATKSSGNYVLKAGDTMSGSLKNSLVTGTYLSGNQGKALVSSTASAGSYVALLKSNSTNGYFQLSSYEGKLLLTYTAKSTVDAGTNSVTKATTLMNESGVANFAAGIDVNGNVNSIGGTVYSYNSDKSKHVRMGAGGSDVYLYNSASGKYLQLKDDGTLSYSGTNISLSGHTHSYLPLSGGTVTGTSTFSGTLNLTGSVNLSGTGGNLYFANNKGIALKNTSGTDRWVLYMDTSNKVIIGDTNQASLLQGSSITLSGTSAIILDKTNTSCKVGYDSSTGDGYLANKNGNWLRMRADATAAVAGKQIVTFSSGDVTHKHIRYGSGLSGESGYITFTW